MHVSGSYQHVKLYFPIVSITQRYDHVEYRESIHLLKLPTDGDYENDPKIPQMKMAWAEEIVRHGLDTAHQYTQSAPYAFRSCLLRRVFAVSRGTISPRIMWRRVWWTGQNSRTDVALQRTTCLTFRFSAEKQARLIDENLLLGNRYTVVFAQKAKRCDFETQKWSRPVSGAARTLIERPVHVLGNRRGKRCYARKC